MRGYLHRREGGIYYFRRVIPERLRSEFGGRREWIKSLATKDREEAKRLLPAYVQASNAELATADGQEPVEWALTPVRSADSIRVQRAPTTSLTAIFEAYKTEQCFKPGTAAEWRTIIRGLTTFLGHDDAKKVRPADLDRWRDHLLVERNRRDRLRDPRTVKEKYLSAVRATFGWAVDKRILRDNPASKVVVRVPRKPKLRERDFTEQEATAILAATLLPSEELPSSAALARRWVPWLCAYTGARVNEVGQLRSEDVKQVNDIWTIRITPEAGTVKGNEARTIPLHPHILEQGFLAVAQRAEGPIFYDPSRIRKPDAANRYYKKVGEKLRDWVRYEVGITDPNLQPNHGWRHTFKTRAMEAGVQERITDYIQGHAPRSIGQTYGSVSIRTLDAAIRSIRRFDV